MIAGRANEATLHVISMGRNRIEVAHRIERGGDWRTKEIGVEQLRMNGVRLGVKGDLGGRESHTQRRKKESLACYIRGNGGFIVSKAARGGQYPIE